MKLSSACFGITATLGFLVIFCSVLAGNSIQNIPVDYSLRNCISFVAKEAYYANKLSLSAKCCSDDGFNDYCACKGRNCEPKEQRVFDSCVNIMDPSKSYFYTADKDGKEVANQCGFEKSQCPGQASKPSAAYARALSECWAAYDTSNLGLAQKTFCAAMVNRGWPEASSTTPKRQIHTTLLQPTCTVLRGNDAMPRICSTVDNLKSCSQKSGLAQGICVTDAVFAPCQTGAEKDWNSVTAVCKTGGDLLARWQAMQACLSPEPGVLPEGGALSAAETVMCVTAAVFEPCNWDGDGIIAGTCDKVEFLANCHKTKSPVKKANCARELFPLLKKARSIHAKIVRVKNMARTLKARLINVESKIDDFEAGLASCWASFDDSVLGMAQKALCVSTLALSPCETTTNKEGIVSWTCATADAFKTCTQEPECTQAIDATCKITPCPIGIGKSSPTCESKQCVCKAGYCSVDGSSCVPTPVTKTQMEKGACIFNSIFEPCEQAVTYDWNAIGAVCSNYPEILARWQALQSCFPTTSVGQEGGALSAAETGMCVAVAIFEPCHWDNAIGNTCEIVQTLKGCRSHNPIKIAKCVRTVLPLVQKAASGGGKFLVDIAKIAT